MAGTLRRPPPGAPLERRLGLRLLAAAAARAVERGRELALGAAISRREEPGALEALRQERLVQHALRRPVRVAVALAVAEVARVRAARVAERERRAARPPPPDVLERGLDGPVGGLRLRRERDVDGGLAERDAGLGQPHELDGPGGRGGHREGPRGGVAG